MNIYVASDHAGFDLKEKLKPFLVSLGHTAEDCGAHTFDAEDDYPDFVIPCAQKVAGDPGSFGIVIGGSGQGEAMAANRVPGARAAVYYGASARAQTDITGQSLTLLASTRAHNNANILSLGARFLTDEEAQDAVQAFLTEPFTGESRHKRRVQKLG